MQALADGDSGGAAAGKFYHEPEAKKMK